MSRVKPILVFAVVAAAALFFVLRKPASREVNVGDPAPEFVIKDETGKELKLSKVLNTIGQPGVQLVAMTRRGSGYFIVHVGAPGRDVRPATGDGQPVSAEARQLKV